MNSLHPKKLLLTKWTAVNPISKNKHFLVSRVIEPEPPDVVTEWIELEAVYSKSQIHTSQECACCGHIHPGNRKTQSDFECLACGHQDNADHNAAIVIRKRAINLILHSGTELVGTSKNVLQPRPNANPRKTLAAKAVNARGCLSKKKVTAKQSLEARML